MGSGGEGEFSSEGINVVLTACDISEDMELDKVTLQDYFEDCVRHTRPQQVVLVCYWLY